MKVRTLILTVALTATGVGAVVAVPVAATAAGTAKVVISVDEVTTSFSYLHGGVAAAPSAAGAAGDQIVFRSKLVLKKKTVGHGSVSCVLAGAATSSAVCTGVYSLPKGTVSFVGQGGQGLLHLPVVGGTGSYVGARGVLVVQDVSESLSKDTFSFVTG